MVVLKPPTSPTPSVQPSSRSGRCRTSCSAPWWPPASSSAVKHSTIGPLRLGARPGPRPHDGEQHRVEVLHVDRAAAPQVAVLDLAGERVHLPVVGLGGDDVEVAVQQQRVVAAAPAAPAGDHVGPARRRPRTARPRCRPRRAARRRARPPCAPPGRSRRRSWWCPSGSGRGRCRRPRRPGRTTLGLGLLGARRHTPHPDTVLDDPPDAGVGTRLCYSCRRTQGSPRGPRVRHPVRVAE